MRRRPNALLVALLSALSGTLLAPAVARADDASTRDARPASRPDARVASAVAIDGYFGVASFGAFGGGYVGGLEVAGHGERLAWSGFLEGAYGGEGRAIGVGASFGEVVAAFGPFELQAHLMAGEHWYSEVHALGATQGSTAASPTGCSGLPGASGQSPFLGLRVGVATRPRPGTRFLAGLWLDASDDLVKTSETLTGNVMCASPAGPLTQESRTIHATTGGYRLGLVFRVGWSLG